MNGPPVPLNEVEAANLLGLRPATLRNWRCKKVGPPFHKLQGKIVYLLPDLIRYMVRNRHDPERPAAPEGIALLGGK